MSTGISEASWVGGGSSRCPTRSRQQAPQASALLWHITSAFLTFPLLSTINYALE